jgi:FixJ family two-component response regulator
MSAPANKYIAVVDDDESVCRSFSRLLRTAGYHPVPFHSAEEFLSDRNRPHFECLVLDVQLDGISGIELWRRLAAVGDNTPVVFITAHNDSTSGLEAEACGCAGYFRKTDTGDTILGAIRHAVNSNSNPTTNPQPS